MDGSISCKYDKNNYFSFLVQYLLQEKFLTPQLEIVSTDPGKFLAWLVLLSSVLTFILGHVVYLAMFLLIYITWAYSEHIQENDASDKDGDENEWLLDKFFCFLQQLDNGKNILSSYCINNFIADVDLPNHIVMVQYPSLNIDLVPIFREFRPGLDCYPIIIR